MLLLVQSCIHVEMDFVSPENLRECIRLTEEVRLLPSHHHAKEDKLEVCIYFYCVIYDLHKVIVMLELSERQLQLYHIPLSKI